MGWTIYYNCTGRLFNENDLQIFKSHEAKWAPLLSKYCETYKWELSENRRELSGFTKFHPRFKNRHDFETIIAALQEIESEIPDVDFSVSDDFYLEPTKPSTLGNAKGLLKRLDKEITTEATKEAEKPKYKWLDDYLEHYEIKYNIAIPINLFEPRKKGFDWSIHPRVNEIIHAMTESVDDHSIPQMFLNQEDVLGFASSRSLEYRGLVIELPQNDREQTVFKFLQIVGRQDLAPKIPNDKKYLQFIKTENEEIIA